MPIGINLFEILEIVNTYISFHSRKMIQEWTHESKKSEQKRSGKKKKKEKNVFFSSKNQLAPNYKTKTRVDIKKKKKT